MSGIQWGMLIVNYLMLGGLSAGIYFVSGLATYLQNRDSSGDTKIARYGAMIAPWPVMIGSLLLIFDLGRWYRFYKLFLHFRWQSAMSIGSWLLLLFTILALVNFYVWLPVTARQRVVQILPRRWSVAHRDLSHWRRPLAMAGFPLSIGVGIYTGVLLGSVQSRPFWNTNLVAQIFLFSALSTGCAALILALSLNKNQIDAGQARFLYTLDICFITLEVFVILPFMIHGELSMQPIQASLDLIFGGPLTWSFWFFFLGLGILAPLLLEIWEMVPIQHSSSIVLRRRSIAALAAVLVLVGGWMLRYVFVYAGQMSLLG